MTENLDSRRLELVRAAARPDDPSRMILAVEANGASYRDSGSVRDRDRLRKEHLERLGWRFHRFWSTNWFHDPDTEVAKLREAYGKAVAVSPPPEPFEPPEPLKPPEPFEPREPFEPPEPFEPREPPQPSAPPQPPEPIDPLDPSPPPPPIDPAKTIATRPTSAPVTR